MAAMASDVAARTVLADLVPGERVRDVALVVGSATFVGLASQLSFALPHTPVPVSGQTFAVLLAGAALGPARAVLGMALYLLMGGLGVPWYADQGHGFGGVTFGYVVGFVLAGALVGALARRGGDRTPARMAATMVLGTLAIYAAGVPWLALSLHVPLSQALTLGVRPFLAGDALKVAAAAGIFPLTWRLVNRRS